MWLLTVSETRGHDCKQADKGMRYLATFLARQLGTFRLQAWLEIISLAFQKLEPLGDRSVDSDFKPLAVTLQMRRSHRRPVISPLLGCLAKPLYCFGVVAFTKGHDSEVFLRLLVSLVGSLGEPLHGLFILIPLIRADRPERILGGCESLVGGFAAPPNGLQFIFLYTLSPEVPVRERAFNK